jgi:hypothetical protein
VSLHALVFDYMRARFRRSGPALASLHGELLDAYRARCSDGWATGPDDGYYFDFLAYHPNAARRVEELQRYVPLVGCFNLARPRPCAGGD